MTASIDRSERDLAEVSDSPEWTDDEWKRAEPFSTAFPELAASLAAGIEIVPIQHHGPVAIELEADLAAYYRSFGEDAQKRLNADLRQIAGLPEA